MSKKLALEECLKHIPEPITPEIKAFAMDEVFKDMRYIFTRREGKKQVGYCTHCHEEFPTDGLPNLAWLKCPDENCRHDFKPGAATYGGTANCPWCAQDFKIQALRHNSETKCPKCDSRCTAKASGVGRSRMIDEAYFTYYMKSAADPRAIVAVGIYAVRDFTGPEYWAVKTQYSTKSMYVFRPGIGGDLFCRNTWYYTDPYEAKPSRLIAGDFTRATRVKCQFNRDHLAHIYTCYSRESIKEAVAGTPFQYSTWEKFNERDMTEFFDLFSRYPCVEYLSKLGLSKLIRDRLNGYHTYSALNWRGKNVLSVLKMTKQDLQEVREKDLPMTFAGLRMFQAGKSDGSRLTPAEALEISNKYGYDCSALFELQKHTSIRKITRYVAKQYHKDKRRGKKKHYYSEIGVLTAYRDYLRECVDLSLDLSNESVLFPGDIHRAHQNTTKQVKYKADQLLNKKIKQRIEKIKYLQFEHKGLLIRPAVSTEELIREGDALGHCVGGYAKGYAEGKGDIFFIRRTAKPNKPYYTVEIRGDVVVQCYGKKNRLPDDAVKEFLEVFKAQKLTKKDREREVAV